MTSFYEHYWFRKTMSATVEFCPLIHSINIHATLDQWEDEKGQGDAEKGSNQFPDQDEIAYPVEVMQTHPLARIVP
jgi:hypothetical protein